MRSIPSPQKRATSAVYLALTALVLAATALVVFERARGRRLVVEISRLGGDPRSPGAEAVFGAVTVFAILIMLFAGAAIACAVAYLNWLVRARRYADLPAIFPVLASWLVPVVNLFAPALLVDRLWWASRPPLDRRERWVALLSAWWLSWLVALTLVLVRLWPGASHGGGSLTGFGMLELTAVVVASLLCGATVRQISAVQAAGAGHRHREPAGRRLLRPPAETSAPLATTASASPDPQDSPPVSASTAPSASPPVSPSVPPTGSPSGSREADTREEGPRRAGRPAPEQVPQTAQEPVRRERAQEVHPAGQ
ncbi:DUF4328 domain-containing protein [Streptosporangium sp. NPDC050855]|uniref:DUF4328 domain-containing protein n=1 Tax=Streptosporangium sp. NPDC050855 TaxID=3366194 RepID=UPI0037AE5FA8